MDSEDRDHVMAGKVRQNLDRLRAVYSVRGDRPRGELWEETFITEAAGQNLVPRHQARR